MIHRSLQCKYFIETSNLSDRSHSAYSLDPNRTVDATYADQSQDVWCVIRIRHARYIDVFVCRSRRVLPMGDVPRRMQSRRGRYRQARHLWPDAVWPMHKTRLRLRRVLRWRDAASRQSVFWPTVLRNRHSRQTLRRHRSLSGGSQALSDGWIHLHQRSNDREFVETVQFVNIYMYFISILYGLQFSAKA